MTIEELKQHCKQKLATKDNCEGVKDECQLVLDLIQQVDDLRIENENIRQHSITHSTMQIMIESAVKEYKKALELAVSAKHNICGECPSSTFSKLPDDLKCDLHCETWAGFDNWCCWTTPKECWQRYFLIQAKDLLMREVISETGGCER